MKHELGDAIKADLQGWLDAGGQTGEGVSGRAGARFRRAVTVSGAAMPNPKAGVSPALTL